MSFDKDAAERFIEDWKEAIAAEKPPEHDTELQALYADYASLLEACRVLNAAVEAFLAAVDDPDSASGDIRFSIEQLRKAFHSSQG